MTLQTEFQKASVPAVISLYVLDATSAGGTLHRFVPDTQGSSSIVFQGNTYLPVPIEVSGFVWSGVGRQPTPRLKVSKMASTFYHQVLANDDLRGGTLTRIRTLDKYLDGQAEASNSTFASEQYLMVQKSHQDAKMIEWILATPLDFDNVKLPRRQALRTCTHTYRHYDTATSSWVYTKALCPYTGSRYYNKQGTQVSDPTEDVPSKELESCCIVRFGENAELPFGGFPALGKY